MADQETH
jgi:hypothetical protein